MDNSTSILFLFHCEENAGYAIERLASAFKEAAHLAGYEDDNIMWSYRKINSNNSNAIAVSYQSASRRSLFYELCKKNRVETAMAFDLQYPMRIISTLRAAGAKRIISYWGASMSSPNKGLVLLAKKAEWYLRLRKPDLFVFESDAMRRTATHGRGIPLQHTAVVPLGVDLGRFFPTTSCHFAHDVFQIPKDRKIVFYSGHMEARKGIRVILEAARELVDRRGDRRVHFLLCGNRGDEAAPYLDIISDAKAKAHVTFAGYRDDIPTLMRSSSIGVIASTGWDSFTMSSVEMMASGLPLIVSDLQGLSETIEAGVSGFLITPGDHLALADRLQSLVSDNELRERMGRSSRLRVETHFSRTRQIESLSRIIRHNA